MKKISIKYINEIREKLIDINEGKYPVGPNFFVAGFSAGLEYLFHPITGDFFMDVGKVILGGLAGWKFVSGLIGLGYNMHSKRLEREIASSDKSFYTAELLKEGYEPKYIKIGLEEMARDKFISL